MLVSSTQQAFGVKALEISEEDVLSCSFYYCTKSRASSDLPAGLSKLSCSSSSSDGCISARFLRRAMCCSSLSLALIVDTGGSVRWAYSSCVLCAVCAEMRNAAQPTTNVRKPPRPYRAKPPFSIITINLSRGSRIIEERRSRDSRKHWHLRSGARDTDLVCPF